MVCCGPLGHARGLAGCAQVRPENPNWCPVGGAGQNPPSSTSDVVPRLMPTTRCCALVSSSGASRRPDSPENHAQLHSRLAS